MIVAYKLCIYTGEIKGLVSQDFKISPKSL